ncbi:MAG: metal-sulfur cluster assembly factor [Gaiellaceae bacterium]
MLRDVVESDLDVLFEQQRDPEAVAMAVFPAREREAFDAHWRKILADERNVVRVIEALRSVEDPELGMDIVELGLLYDAEVNGPRVKVLYSLTSMGCPAGPLIQQNIEEVLRSLPEVEDVETELTWDPPWTPEKMSDDAKFILGFG